jgi:ABC-type lipoprotein release transport system permease subunit
MILPVNLRTDHHLFGLTSYRRDISAALDPVTISLVAVMLLTVAGLSFYLPSRRAASVDPVLVLREE